MYLAVFHAERDDVGVAVVDLEKTHSRCSMGPFF